MTAAEKLDVSALPTYAFGHRSLMWWGTAALMAIEGSVFAMAVVSYFYLRGRVPEWPVGGPPPRLLWGTINTLVLLASIVPNQWVKAAAEREDLRSVRWGLLVSIAFAVVFTAIRVLEFGTLYVRWDENAYGSMVWTLLGLHTSHLVTDLADTMVLTVLMFTGPITGRRFVDVSENSLYWYFVVLSWLPIYAVVYFGSRLL